MKTKLTPNSSADTASNLSRFGARRPAGLRLFGLAAKILLLGAISACLLESANAANKWWQGGAGTANNTSSNWYPSDSVTTATTLATTDVAIFSVGSSFTGAYTISGTPTAAGMLVEEGTITMGGTWGAFPGTAGVITVNSGGTLAISVSTSLNLVAGATLVLNGGRFRNTNTATTGSFIDTDATITLNGGGILSATGGSTAQVIVQATSVISGTGPLTKDGNAILAVAAVCNYSGATIVNDGQLRCRTTANVFPTGTDLTVTSPGIFSLNNINQRVASLTGNGSVTLGSATLTIGGSTSPAAFTGAISSSTSGDVTKTGSGTLTLAGANSYNGTLTVSQGNINVTSTGALCDPVCDVVVNGGSLNLSNATQTIENLTGTGGTIYLGTGHTLTNAGIGSGAYLGTITGPGGFTKSDANNLTLGGANTYDGLTVLSGTGTITVSNATALGSTTGKTIVSSGAGLNFNSGVSFTINEPIEIAGNGNGVASGGAIFVQGTGTTITFGGTVLLNANAAVGSSGSAGNVTFQGSPAFTNSGSGFNLLLNGASGSGVKSITGVIGLGTGGLLKAQSGTWVLSGLNTYSGPTIISNGTLSVDSIVDVGAGPSALGAPTTVSDGTISLGTGTSSSGLKYTGSGDTSDRVLDLAGTTGGVTLDASGSGPLVLTSDLTASGAGSKTLTLSGTSTATNTIGGAIVDNGGANKTAVTKSSTGKWVLAGDSTYTGNTTVSGGTLQVDGSLTGTAVTISSGGTLGGNGTISGGTVTLNSGGTLAPGASIGTLTLDTSPSLSGTNLMEIDRDASQTADKLVLTTGTLTYGGTLKVVNIGATPQGADSFTLFDAPNYGGAFSAYDLPALPGGFSWYTGYLTVDGSILVNRPPSNTDKSYTRAAGTTLKLSKSALLVGATDPDSGDAPASVSAVGSGVEGATVTQDATYIYYAPVNDNADTIQYSTADMRGGLTTNNISITVVNEGGLAQSIAYDSGGVTVVFAGIPGISYDVERSATSDFSSYTTLLTTNAPPAGIFTIIDSSPLNPSGFYRTKQN